MHKVNARTVAVALTLFFILLQQGCCSDPGNKLIVKKVIDGDSFIVSDQGNEKILNLAFIDAPEREQPFGREAKTFLESIVLNKVIHLSESGEVMVGEQNVNITLLQAGMAWLSPQTQRYGQQFSFSEAQSDAMNNGKGLWSLAHELRIPPWVWREQSKHPSRPKHRRPVNRHIGNDHQTGNGNDR